MAVKVVDIDGIGKVTLTKRRDSRNMRLGFAQDGSVRVSLPLWAPYQAGIHFAQSKSEWVQQHRPAPVAQTEAGDRIGKAHRIIYNHSDQASRPSVRVTNVKITVTLPMGTNIMDAEVQKATQRGAHKALKLEADQLLPQRLDTLARTHGFSYQSVTTKRLTSRWGSCSQHHEIILNTYLMQLPWHLIDYVIVHELVHTEHLNHSASFWQRFEQVLPDARNRRKQLKEYQTAILPS